MNWLSTIHAFAESLVDKGLSYLESEVTRYRSMEEGIARLRGTTVRIYSVLIDTEERRYLDDESVKDWLRYLRSIFFDADDLLDEYQTAVNVYNRNSSGGSRHKRKWHQISPSMGPEWGPLQRRRFALEIEKIDSRLEELIGDRRNFRLRGMDRTKRMLLRPSPSKPGPDHESTIIVGRQFEKDCIVNLLISDQNLEGSNLGTKVIPDVAIRGPPGIGKTTLARLVHDDPRIQSHFDFTAWVLLTDKFDTRAAMKEIYQTITGERCYLDDLKTLQNNLRHYLMTRKDNKFFLVIDNLWADDFDFWKNLEALLLCGGDGSKVLITTCNWKTYEIMHSSMTFTLHGLHKKDCWQIIKSLALPPGFYDDDRDLDMIGTEIANMCHGSPIAAKVLGAVLYGRDIEEWETVLDDMWVLIDFSTVDLASLRISYHSLHYYLKQCFAYCSIFPEGYVFERDQVIRCWMAEGLIEPNGRRRMEAVGKQYFDELIWRSLFEKISVDTKGQVDKYKIPSLIYHHGILFSDYEYCSLECDKPLSETKRGKPDQVRYASFLQPKYTSATKLECLEPYQNLRTLKFFHESSDGMVPLNSIPENFFHKFVDLRVLDLSNSDLEQVPDSVCGLIHLRFLGLSNTNIKTLPENICDLFNLQTLELKGCLKFAVLPEGLRMLINLRHLDFHLDWEKITDLTDVALPPGIGELVNLQTLSRFNVGASAKGQYCNIKELKNLNLRGDLCILNLEKVQSASDARNANLGGKVFIERLMLRWDNSARNDQILKQQSKEVINFLQPNNRLSCLWIVNYPGNEFPDWIGYESFLSLATIQISNCSSFSFLPLLSKLPRLENLDIDSVPEDSMSMPEGFPSLKHLNLLDLGFERLHLQFDIPLLKKIHVSDCNDLQELIIHRHLHDKFEKGSCPNLTTITCVPPK